MSGLNSCLISGLIYRRIINQISGPISCRISGPISCLISGPILGPIGDCYGGDYQYLHDGTGSVQMKPNQTRPTNPKYGIKYIIVGFTKSLRNSPERLIPMILNDFLKNQYRPKFSFRSVFLKTVFLGMLSFTF